MKEVEFKVGDIVWSPQSGWTRLELWEEAKWPNFYFRTHNKMSFWQSGKYELEDQCRSLLTKEEALAAGFGPIPDWLQQKVKVKVKYMAYFNKVRGEITHTRNNNFVGIDMFLRVPQFDVEWEEDAK
jgi:hypothetical protein